MKTQVRIVAAAALALSACTSQGAENRVPEWLPGFWEMTHDEDNGPTGNLAEFRSDGTYVYYELDCRAHPTLPFHVYNGDIYVTNVIANKGPVSVVFHPSEDHLSFTYTSNRTFNTARYQRVALTACKKHGG